MFPAKRNELLGIQDLWPVLVLPLGRGFHKHCHTAMHPLCDLGAQALSGVAHLLGWRPLLRIP